MTTALRRMAGRTKFSTERGNRQWVGRRRPYRADGVYPAVLDDMVAWYDAADLGVADQKWRNRGWGGSALDAWMGSGRVAYIENGALNLWGTTGNYASVPDEAALDITGDIEIVCQVNLSDWTPATENAIFARNTAADPNRAWFVSVGTSGALKFSWYSTGSAASGLFKSSTATPTVADGATLWIKVTLDVDNGAAGNDLKFYTCPDQATEPTGGQWVQLGSTVTTAGVTALPNITAGAIAGFADFSGTYPLTGAVKRAIVRNGIGGSTVLDVDFSTASNFARAFTCTTGQLVTVTQTAAHVGNNALRCPGASGNYWSVPDADNLDIVGDLEIVARVSMADWTPATSTRYMAAKYQNSGNQRSWLLDVRTTGELGFTWSTNGTATTGYASSVATGFTDGASYWVKITLDVDNGSGGYDLKFWTAADAETEPSSWSQLGSTRTAAGVTSIYAGTAPVTLGAYADGGDFPGSIRRLIVRSGIGGTKVLDVDPSVAPNWCGSFPATTGQTVKITTSLATGNDPLVLPWSSENYAYLPGGAGQYCSIPDAANVTPTTTLDFRVALSRPDWSTLEAYVGSQYNPTGNQRAWEFGIDASGNLVFYSCADGATATGVTSTATVYSAGAIDGSLFAIRAVWSAATPSVDFYTKALSGPSGAYAAITSDSGWTQLGSTRTGANVKASIFNSSSAVGMFGATSDGATDGSYYASALKIDGSLVAGINCATDITDGGASTFTATTGQTVTVSRATSGKKTVLVTRPTVLVGTDDTASVPSNALLDFAATDSFTAGTVGRHFATQPASARWIAKRNGGAGWALAIGTTGGQTAQAYVQGAAGSGSINSLALAYGTAHTLAMVRSGGNLPVYDNGTQLGTVADTSTSTSNTVAATIGSGEGGANYIDAEVHGAFVARHLLTAGELHQIAQFYGSVA